MRFGATAKFLPLFQLIETAIQLRNAFREMRGNRNRRRCRGGQFLLERPAQARRCLRLAFGQRGIRLAQQAANLTQDLLLDGRSLGARSIIHRQRRCVCFLGKRCGLCISLSFGCGQAFSGGRGMLLGFARSSDRGLALDLLRQLTGMFCNDFLASGDGFGSPNSLRLIRRCGQGEPSMVMMLKHAGIQGIKVTMAVPIQRRANRFDLGNQGGRLHIMGMQHIELLLEDLINAFVFITDQLQQLTQLSRVLHRLGRELANTADRAVHHQERDIFRIANFSHGLTQNFWVGALSGNGQPRDVAPARCRQDRHIHAAGIDQLGESRLSRALLGWQTHAFAGGGKSGQLS